MLIKLENPQLLTKAVELISDLVSEVRIKLNEFGLSITAMDPANVAMVNFKLPKSTFKEYEAGQETLGINLDDLKKILKRCGPNSILVIERKETLLHIEIQDRIKRHFTLGLIDIDSEERPVPGLEFTSNIVLNSQDIVDAIDDASVVDDACSFIVENGKFIIEARGMNSSRVEFSEDKATIQSGDCKARYSLEYLQKFMKGAKICEKTSLKFANNHPLRIDFNNSNMELSFILAPRSENED